MKIKLNSGWAYRCAAVFAGLLMAAVLRAVPVSADESIFGPVDTFSGVLIPDSSGEETEGPRQPVWISDNTFYDFEKEAFGYPVGDLDVYASVADGMILTERVGIIVPEELTAVIYRDGHPMQFTTGIIEDIGSYTLEVSSEGQVMQLFSFMIVNGITNKVLNYNMPDGFRITDAVRDGEPIGWSRNYVDTSTEGRYVISYECSRARVAYTLKVTVDTTPPTLIFGGIDEDGKARGPVSFAKTDDNDTVQVIKDDEPVGMLLTFTLTASGRYVVNVFDEAGNSTSYPFIIMMYLDRNGQIFGIVLLVVIVAVVALFIYHKKHLRVR